MGLHPWWVTGLTDGDGCFTYSRHTTGTNLDLYFSVKLTATDLAVLQELQAFFGGGSIYHMKARAPAANGGFTKVAKLYRVSDLATLHRVEAHFIQYPLVGHRAEAFEIWRTMLALKALPGRMTPEGRASLFEFADQLSACSPRNRPWDGNAAQGSP
jgi:hypothetical protein